MAQGSKECAARVVYYGEKKGAHRARQLRDKYKGKLETRTTSTQTTHYQRHNKRATTRRVLNEKTKTTCIPPLGDGTTLRFAAALLLHARFFR